MHSSIQMTLLPAPHDSSVCIESFRMARFGHVVGKDGFLFALGVFIGLGIDV